MKELTTTTEISGRLPEQVLIQGDLAKLSPSQRANYYMRVCESLGLNPLTKPFEYIVLNGKLTLYARRDAADQLRKIHGVSCRIMGRERVDDLYVVACRARDAQGREDEATGVVNLSGLQGDNLANALMKAETKAKRRVTLSICGLGWMDETEVETTPSQPVRVDTETGEILEDLPVPETEHVMPTNEEFLEALDDLPEEEPVRPPNAATEKQVKLIHTLYRLKFPQTEEGKQRLLEFKAQMLGDAHTKARDLDKRRASWYIDQLQELPDIEEK